MDKADNITSEVAKAKFESLDVILNFSKDKLLYQSDVWNALDSKNSIVLAVYGITLAVFSIVDKQEVLFCPEFVLSFWLFFNVLGIIFSLLSIKPRVFDMPPNVHHFIDKYLEKNESDTKIQLLSNIREVIIENNKAISKKLFLLKWSINFFLPVSLGITVIVIIFAKIL